jgi:uncharacterized membrane protein YraQ (UPF0718 family)
MFLVTEKLLNPKSLTSILHLFSNKWVAIIIWLKILSFVENEMD